MANLNGKPNWLLIFGFILAVRLITIIIIDLMLHSEKWKAIREKDTERKREK